jgi:hypothetical protein
MGTFLTSIHVRSTDRAAIQAQLLAQAKAAGQRPAEADEEADRTVILSGPDPGGWCSVYDEAGEGQDTKVLDALAKALSRDAPAFWLLVHDSDDLLLSLFQRGKRLDRYHSGRRRGPVEERLAAWAPCLAPGQDEATLRAVFEHRGVFAEEALRPLGQALGVDPEALSRSHRDLDGQAPAGGICLRFRQVDRAEPAAPTGPPRLRSPLDEARLAGHPGLPAPRPVEAAVDGALQLSLTLRNQGGPGRGVQVRVSADTACARWETAQLILGDPRLRAVQEAALIPRGDELIADFPDVALPPGLPGLAVPPSGSSERWLKQLFSTQVHVNLRGVGQRPGEGLVQLAIVPTGGEGSAGRFPVRVRSTAGRPLRALPTVHPSQLAPLEADDLLVGLAILRDLDLAQLGALAQALAPLVPAEGKVQTTRYARTGLTALPTAPKLSSGGAARFLESKRFRGLLEGLTEGSSQVSAAWEPGEATLEIGYGILGFGDPCLGVLFQLRTPDRQADAALAQAWDALGGALIQGLITRWGGPSGLEMTPYELACGVMGQCTLERAWVSRWLRGLGRGLLWLGPELGQALDGLAEPRRLRIDDLPAAEAQLAALLPSGSDWQVGVRQRYLHLPPPR